MYLSSFICTINLNSIWKLLLLTYVISWIIEIARKIRCKEKEEKGVKTYTAVLGIPKATALVWGLETILLIVFNLIAPIKLYIIIFYIIMTFLNISFIIKQSKLLSKCVEYFADIYVMMILISLCYLII